MEKWKVDKTELRYRKISDYEKDVQSFAQTLAQRGNKGDMRKPISKQLKDLDVEINLQSEDVSVKNCMDEVLVDKLSLYQKKRICC